MNKGAGLSRVETCRAFFKRASEMSNVALQIAVIVLLILLNGFFAMSETALVSSRKARLRQRAEEGDRGRGLRWSWPTRQTASSPRCRSESR